MYVAVKGGERAIVASYQMLAQYRRGDAAVPELSLAQIEQQMPLAVARVMAEGSLYDPYLAALAIKQAAGDLMEAVFLLRAYRTTLSRFAYTQPLETDRMFASRRISATFKDIPGGQMLGPTYDYTQRLLDFALEAGGPVPQSAQLEHAAAQAMPPLPPLPRVTDWLEREALLQQEPIPEGDPDPYDLTRDPLLLPATRDARLQNLARADEGFLLALAYSSQRGYGASHPYTAELRFGQIELELFVPELGFAVTVAQMEVTECQMLNQFTGDAKSGPQLTRGYGLTLGYNERKAMAMALLDRAMRAHELGEPSTAPANDQEFVLSHSDNVESSGFVQHLKLPHYVDFQGDLELLRRLRAEYEQAQAAAAAMPAGPEQDSHTPAMASAGVEPHPPAKQQDLPS